MPVRSRFLVYWSGASIQLDPNRLDPGQRGRYVARLRDSLQRGLWMTAPPERVHGHAGSWISYTIPMTCFTEIKLSQTRLHATRYGLLGIAVDRQFVLNRFGGPVQYVRNGPDEMYVQNLEILNNGLAGSGAPAHVAFGMNACFVKGMSTHGSDDCLFLEEHEWRVVQSDRAVAMGLIVPTPPSASPSPPPFRLMLQPFDVRLVILPDDDTRDMVARDTDITGWFQVLPRPPVYLTLAECEQF